MNRTRTKAICPANAEAIPNIIKSSATINPKGEISLCPVSCPNNVTLKFDSADNIFFGEFISLLRNECIDVTFKNWRVY
jgi:hypothetical protein